MADIALKDRPAPREEPPHVEPKLPPKRMDLITQERLDAEARADDATKPADKK